MILSAVALIATATGAYHVYKKKNIDLFELKEKWCKFIEEIDPDSNQSYKIIETFKKEYGYDFIVSIPISKGYEEFEKQQYKLENALQCNIMMNWVKESSSAYVRAYQRDPLNTDLIRYKWNTIMKNLKLYNFKKETLELSNLVVNEKYGYDCNIIIPDGFSQNILKENLDILNNSFGYMYIKFKDFTNKLETKIVTTPLPDGYQFKPVETEPYQLYIGTTHAYEDIIVDMSIDPHILISGATNSGKSVLLRMALANQIYHHDDKKIELYFIEAAIKTNDFDDLINCKQTKAFAYTYNYAYKTLNYICEQIKMYSKIFSKAKVKNIYEYNKKSKDKLPFRYILIEELPSMMAESEKGDIDHKIKSKCIDCLNTIASQGRFAGIYLIGTVQRSDKESIKPTTKANFNTRIALKQNNEASSLVVIDCVDAKNLPIREAIILTSGDYHRIKTPYVDNKVIYNLIKDSIEKNHKLTNFNQTNSDNNNTSDNSKNASNTTKNNSNNSTIQEVATAINNIIPLESKSKGDVNVNGLFDKKR